MRIINRTSNLKVNLPSRGYAIRTKDEKLIVIKRRDVDYDKMMHSIKNAFSIDKHLFIQIIRVAA